MANHVRRLNVTENSYLVTDFYGNVHLRSELVLGQWGAQKGQLVHPDDLDERGSDESRNVARPDRNQPGRRTGQPEQTWRTHDENGDPV